MGISDDLRTELEQVFALGFLDATNGAPPHGRRRHTPALRSMPPVLRNNPPCSEITPPAQKYAPPPLRSMPPPTPCMAGPVTDDDTIPLALAPPSPRDG